MMRLTKEEQILYQHFNDLISLSYQRSIPVFSQFVSPNELEFAYAAMEDFYGKGMYFSGVQYALFGGYKDAERKMICFLPEYSGEEQKAITFPISCVQIGPANKKFCDNLNHRDYLGTVMNLGITRAQIGDILIKKDKVHNACTGYIFCKMDKADLLLEVNRIKHTTVSAQCVDFASFGWKAEFKELTGSVSSFRLDAVLAVAIKASRSQGLTLIQEKNVFLNGRCCTENAKKLEEGDIFSIRGYGKFSFEKANSLSKKGRYHITIKQYI